MVIGVKRSRKVLSYLKMWKTLKFLVGSMVIIAQNATNTPFRATIENHSRQNFIGAFWWK